MRYKAIVKVVHEFEFETDKEQHEEIAEEVVDLWENLLVVGKDSEKYHETEIEYQEI